MCSYTQQRGLINQPKVGSLKRNMTDKQWTREITRKEEEEQISNTSKVETTLDATGNMKALNHYHKYLYANNFEMQPKGTISQKKYNLAKLAKANRVLPRERTGHSKHPLPTTQEKTLLRDITRWSTLKSD